MAYFILRDGDVIIVFVLASSRGQVSNSLYVVHTAFVMAAVKLPALVRIMVVSRVVRQRPLSSLIERRFQALVTRSHVP